MVFQENKKPKDTVVKAKEIVPEPIKEVPKKVVPKISEEERIRMIRMNADIGLMLATKINGADDTPSWSDDGQDSPHNGPSREYDPLEINTSS